ncbi:UNVERIFIED_CONTAM: hypothetical protein K2H54_058688 [Gekko kuhli]
MPTVLNGVWFPMHVTSGSSPQKVATERRKDGEQRNRTTITTKESPAAWGYLGNGSRRLCYKASLGNPLGGRDSTSETSIWRQKGLRVSAKRELGEIGGLYGRRG